MVFYTVRTQPLDGGPSEVENLINQMDTQRGVYLSSGVEYPGRYSRWDLGLINPPLEIIAYPGKVIFQALNPRGEFLIKIFKNIFINSPEFNLEINFSSDLIKTRTLEIKIIPSDKIFPEEARSSQPTVMTPLRILIKNFKNQNMGIRDRAYESGDLDKENQPEENLFGFYGAFGYELIFEFDPIKLSASRQERKKEREKEKIEKPVKLFHLFFADVLWIIDRRREKTYQAFLELELDGQSLQGLDSKPFDSDGRTQGSSLQILKDLGPSEIKSMLTDEAYERMVIGAKERMKLGDIFEIILSREYQADFIGSRAEVFKRMKAKNPSPYELFCQFGDEQLIGTSPEMFVRVSGRRIESCPISGTIRRGSNAMEDEVQIRELLNSSKDEVELTMCTDVDRNDKSRLCEPESIRLISRRSIETYSSLFHTVDHVEGILRPEFDGIDGLLSHLWAVTLTGAPKRSAVQIIEKMEGASRRWYGGAVGYLGLNGDVNTAITIRTVHFDSDSNLGSDQNYSSVSKAHYRVGASLVWDSIPEAEVEETKTKSAPFYLALGLPVPGKSKFPSLSKSNTGSYQPDKIGTGYRAVMIDNQDSFVHTLAGYFRRFGMEVLTYRAGISIEDIEKLKPDLIIHSPGPGRPAEFHVPEYVQKITGRQIPQFGVCLGLQGMVEAFGGELIYLANPRHGKPWTLSHEGKGLMRDLPQGVQVGAYHSIIAHKKYLPQCFEILAENEQGDVMAIAHKSEPIMAVQFHPESILSFGHEAGLKIIRNVIEDLILKKIKN